MEIRRMKLSDLRPADYNPRVELKPGEPEYEALKVSVETDGTVLPIIWNETTGRIVGGHQRLRLLTDMGVEETDVSVVRFDETKEKQANVALNRIEGDWDEEKLHDLFAELDTDEIFSTGFTEAELHSIYPEGDEEDTDDIYGDTDDEQSEDDDSEESATVEAEFTVFLSFPLKKAAEEWLKSEGIEQDFSAGRNLIIRMEGQRYGD
ncbi:MAG: ParB N-terminal domain-containing protein [Clostridia bacterium]|nr:ParB N-terminal domain-containing protein [Oscillospiraceae bacterium]MBQ3551673.1 ParB N-terminal domain-containing protein [Clostridia bacterium]